MSVSFSCKCQFPVQTKFIHRSVCWYKTIPYRKPKLSDFYARSIPDSVKGMVSSSLVTLNCYIPFTASHTHVVFIWIPPQGQGKNSHVSLSRNASLERAQRCMTELGLELTRFTCFLGTSFYFFILQLFSSSLFYCSLPSITFQDFFKIFFFSFSLFPLFHLEDSRNKLFRCLMFDRKEWLVEPNFQDINSLVETIFLEHDCFTSLNICQTHLIKR